MSQKKATGAVQRTIIHPFAVPKDVLLTVVLGDVVVTRLYDGERSVWGNTGTDTCSEQGEGAGGDILRDWMIP